MYLFTRYLNIQFLSHIKWDPAMGQEFSVNQLSNVKGSEVQ